MIFRQAIIVKYLGPTDTRGSRYRAFCDAKAIVWPQRHDKDPSENALDAAQALKSVLGWPGTLRGGSLPRHGAGNASWVFVID